MTDPRTTKVSTRTVPVLGVEIADLNWTQFWSTIEDFFAQASPAGRFVCFRDVNGIVEARDNPALAAAHSAALLNVADGVPVLWAARAAGGKFVERLCGPDTMLKLCEAGVARQWRHAFVGSTPETQSALIRALLQLYPELNIVAAISPPFRSLTVTEDDAILARLQAARPHIIWVGLGSPKQEIWMLKHADKIPAALCMGVGAAFDMHAGNVRRAPAWIQPTGLEFLYRAFQEPRRLAPRYLRCVPRFIVAILGEALKTAIRSRRAVVDKGPPGP